MRTFFTLIALTSTSIAAAQAAPSPAEPARPPNIVLIVSDDQGYADLGSFGGQEIKTPHLDRLAREGVRMLDFYVTWPACTPSRGSILTGRYPQRNGLYDMIRNDMVNYRYQYDEVTYALSPEMTLGLDLREVLISEVLRKAGYATSVIGKWDGGRARRFMPLSRGFDVFYGFSNTGIDYFTHERYGIPSMFRGHDRIKEEGYATELFRREALKFLDQHGDQPFFLYLPFNAPHGASSFTHRGAQAPADYTKKTYPNRDPEDPRTVYMSAVTYMDDCIGDVLDWLGKKGHAENTLVIFFADNGGSKIADKGPFRGQKGTMFEGGLRVPALARLPGVIPAGTTCREFLSTLEIFPTLTGAAGAELPKDVVYDGFNMLPVLAGKAHSQRTTLFSQRRREKAARVDNFKWIKTPDFEGLFNLAEDPGETTNLAQEQPEKLADMRARFAAWADEMQAAEPRGPFRNY